MSETFVGIAAVLEALPQIRSCLSEVEAEIDLERKRQAIVRAGAIGCDAFSELVADNELWTALESFYSDPSVRGQVTSSLPNGRFPRLAVQLVTKLLLQLQYQPPEQAAEVVQAAKQLTEDLNQSFTGGSELPRSGLHVVLVELIKDSFEQIQVAICNLNRLAKMDQLAEREVEHAQAVLARAWNYSNALLAVTAIATQFPAVQATVSGSAAAVVNLAGAATDTLRAAMLSLGPSILLQETTSARVISRYLWLGHGPGGRSRLAAYDARAIFNQSVQEAHQRMSDRLEEYRRAAFQDTFRDTAEASGIAHTPSSPREASPPPAPPPRATDPLSGPDDFAPF